MSGKTGRKLDKAIIVALIGLLGTLITALLASPLLPMLLEKTPVPTDPSGEIGSIVFKSDFENGKASGFAFNSEEWEVTKDRGNQVLEMNGLTSDSGIATFGPNDFSDGKIEFQINFRNFDGFILNFRSNVGAQTYTLYFSTLDGEIQLGYGSAANDWNLEFFEGDSIRPFQFNEDVWYDVKMEASGDLVTVWADGNKVLTSRDSRLEQGSMEFAIQGNGTVWIDNVIVWEYLR